ncbi:hypothetical protein JV07_09840 [Salmonella enterica]|nr:hypothetical protein [Salmonella enterica]EAY4988068.1 hypothetical protein [Salmonella enterica]
MNYKLASLAMNRVTLFFDGVGRQPGIAMPEYVFLRVGIINVFRGLCDISLLYFCHDKGGGLYIDYMLSCLQTKNGGYYL